jgi:hypothetical protein
MATSRRAALYVRVSTADRGQTVENQLQPLQEAAGRLGWTGPWHLLQGAKITDEAGAERVWPGDADLKPLRPRRGDSVGEHPPM